MFSPSAADALRGAALGVVQDKLDEARWAAFEARTGRKLSEEEKLRAKVFEEAHLIEHPARYLPRVLKAWERWFGVAMGELQSELGDAPKPQEEER